MHQHCFILWVIEESGLGPVEVIHLVDEGALTKDGVGKVEGEGPVACISGQHALESGMRDLRDQLDMRCGRIHTEPYRMT